MMRCGRAGATARVSQNSGRPSSVPTVPGALGASPLPKPNAIRCAGWPRRNWKSGREVVITGVLDGQGLAVGADDNKAGVGRDVADARHGHAGALCGCENRIVLAGGGGEAEFV